MHAGDSVPVTLPLARFRELWIHTGTTCNLSCPFCHEGSRPGDTRIAAPTRAELAPLFEQAAALGVQRFAFTGGEPLIHREILPILQLALRLRPVLVLTNGTAPFIRKTHQLAMLRGQQHPLSFRVSIDHPDEARHDAGRGLKNFRKAFEGLRLLHEAGFAVGITRLQVDGEATETIAGRFRNQLRRHQLPEDLPIVALPDLGIPRPEAMPLLSVPEFSTARTPPACTRSRMLLRRAEGMRVAPCPLVDDRPDLDNGESLATAVRTPARLLHQRCAICLTRGVDYSGD